MKSRDSLSASTSTPAPESPTVEALRVLTAAPNLYTAIEDYLSNPATPPIVRRMIGHILVLGEQYATVPGVTL